MTDVRNMRKLIESVNGITEQDLLREYNDENEELAYRLEELQEQMLELLGEASGLLSGTSEGSAAEAYWLAHVETALTNDHGYLGGSMTTMQDTIDAIRGRDEDEFEESIDDKAFPEKVEDVSACECGSSDISKWTDDKGRTNVACNSCGDEWMY